MLIIKQAHKRDIPLIAKILRSSLSDRYGQFMSLRKIRRRSVPHIYPYIRRDIRVGRSIRIAYLDGKAVGISNYHLKTPGIVYVNQLFVLTEYQGYGVGSLLFADIKKAAKNRWIMLDAAKKNYQARAWYENKGLICQNVESYYAYGHGARLGHVWYKGRF